MTKEKVVSKKFSLKGWKLAKFIEGKLNRIKETFKIAGSILLAYLAGYFSLFADPKIQTILGLLFWLGWDLFEYWLKEYVEQAE